MIVVVIKKKNQNWLLGTASIHIYLYLYLFQCAWQAKWLRIDFYHLFFFLILPPRVVIILCVF